LASSKGGGGDEEPVSYCTPNRRYVSADNIMNESSS